MDFLLYTQWALTRVLNFDTYGHLLYFTALAMAFTYREWKQMATLAIIFITTFCTALFISIYNLYESPEWFIAFLVPTTVVATAFCNYVYFGYDTANLGFYFHTFIAMLCGPVHGFSFFYQFDTLIAMKDDNISPLLGLTVGVALGQIIVILAVFSIASVVLDKVGIKRLYFIATLSAIAIALAIPLLIEAYP